MPRTRASARRPPASAAASDPADVIPVTVAEEVPVEVGGGGGGGPHHRRLPSQSAPALEATAAEVFVGEGSGGSGGGGGPSRSADVQEMGKAKGARLGKKSSMTPFGRQGSSKGNKSGFFAFNGFGAAQFEFAEDQFGRSSSCDGSPAHMIAFVNRSSGGNEGAAIMTKLQEVLGEDVVFDIKKDRGPERGLELHASDPRVEVRVLVAGGDGTFSWVANAVDQQALRNVRLVVIPLGSGNDMARALGWGKKAPLTSQIPRYVDWARRAPSRVLDVWRLEAIHAPHASGAAASRDSEGVEHGARPLVCNYLSLGADAHVELQFNQRRWHAPEKYKSRLGNFKAHAVVGLQYITSEKKIQVADHVKTLTVDGKVVQLPANLQALIFCNIPSYGAGTQPWGFPRGKSKPMFVDDGFFEVIGLRSLHHFNAMKTTSAHGLRICQGSSMEIELKSARTPFQVDGEPWEQMGGTVTLGPGNPVGVLPGPRFSHRSKKNAKFDALGDSSGEGTMGVCDRTMDDIEIGSPRVAANPALGPTLASTRLPASFG